MKRLIFLTLLALQFNSFAGTFSDLDFSQLIQNGAIYSIFKYDPKTVAWDYEAITMKKNHSPGRCTGPKILSSLNREESFEYLVILQDYDEDKLFERIADMIEGKDNKIDMVLSVHNVSEDADCSRSTFRLYSTDGEILQLVLESK